MDDDDEEAGAELRGIETVTTRVVKTVVTSFCGFPPFCGFGAATGAGAEELHGRCPRPGAAVAELCGTGFTTSGTCVAAGGGAGLLLAPGAGPPISTAGALLCGALASPFPAGEVGFAGGFGAGACGAGAGLWSSVATGRPFESSKVIACGVGALLLMSETEVGLTCNHRIALDELVDAMVGMDMCLLTH